jgi:hypothetical protein
MKDKIFDYLDNELSPTERQTFERQLAIDPDLQTELYVQRDLMTKLQDASLRQQAQARLGNWEKIANEFQQQPFQEQSWFQLWLLRLKKQFTNFKETANDRFDNLAIGNSFELDPQFRGESNDSFPNTPLSEDDFKHLKKHQSARSWWIYAGIAMVGAILLYLLWQFLRNRN